MELHRSRLDWVRAAARGADLGTYTRVRRLARHDGLVRAARVYSKAGEHGALWWAGGVVGAITAAPEDRGRWLRASLVVGIAYGASTSVKHTVRRRRPAFEHLPALIGTPGGLSFPSSHATSSFAAARVMGGTLVPAPPLYAAAGTMALSRIFLGVHYPSDILAGAALGLLLGSVGRPLACP